MNKYIKFLFDADYRFRVLDGKGFFKYLSDEKYLKKKWYSKYKKVLNLENPQTYNEKLQWLKLYDRNPFYSKLVDKYLLREYIAQKIGNEYLIPLVGGPWNSFDDIDFDILPNQFVLKCTHDSGGIIICRDKKTFDIFAAKERINKSLEKNYYLNGREWPYKNVQPRIIAEQYMTEPETFLSDSVSDCITIDQLQQYYGLLDYKFMCFDGVAKLLFLDIGVIGNNEGHALEYYRNVYDSDFLLMPVKETRENYPIKILKPSIIDEMVKIAVLLSKGIPHVRVDLYYWNKKIFVGEMTFFHGSGFSNEFNPPEWDQKIGDWIILPKKK